MAYHMRPAERGQAKPLVGIYAQSGAGKTYSALVLARGFVGPNGTICMIETEMGRGESYADPEEYPEIGGYSVIPLRESFSPKAYGEAITVAEEAKVDALIIDSASHEWEGVGGVLATAALNLKNGKKSMLAWQEPKADHLHHFMLRFMQTPIALVILCMRAKYPMKQRGANWARSDELEPIQADDILSEMFVHGWIEKGSHNFVMTKSTSKALGPILGERKPITTETGERLAAFVAGRTAEAKTAPEAQGPDEEQAAPKEASELLQGIAKTFAEQGREKFGQYWKSLTQGDRASLRPFFPNLEAACIKADAEAKAGADNEDPLEDLAL